jgi:histidyl-tRNA synthetase
MEDKKLSTESYKGTRDFYPEDLRIQDYMFSRMRRAVERFGYLGYNASMIEETDLFRAKSGEEIVNEQTYSFIDRGGRDVTIRPEMTPTLARMVAKKRKELVFPLRWYSIPNLFRYERPQRGRLREFWQLNVDMFGVDSVSADIEIISVAHAVLAEFGATNDDFVVRINDRRITNFFMYEYLGVDDAKAHTLSKLIDRKEKMPEGEFFLRVQDIVGKDAERCIAFLNTKDITVLPDEFLDYETVQDLKKIIDRLAQAGMTNVVYDPSIMRGLDYYTGVVFEVFDTNDENKRALFGGGRYDDLVGLFGVEKVSGIGFGMGDVPVENFLTTHGLLPDSIPCGVDLALCVFGQEYEHHAQELAQYLRKEGLNVAVDISGRKIVSQIKTADKQGIPYIICIGDDEVQKKEYVLKDLAKHEEVTVTQDMIAQLILSTNKKER